MVEHQDAGVAPSSQILPQDGMIDFFQVHPSRTALIVIDMQNAFVDGSVEGYEVPTARGLIPRLEDLIRFARSHAMPVIWTQSDHSAPFGGIMLKKFPGMAEHRILWRGEDSFDLYAGMPQPGEGDYRVVKHKYDAFFETDLDAILRNRGIRTVIITGVATNVCCESTARSAFMRDYEVVFPADANATFDPQAHAATLESIKQFFGRVMDTETLLAEMRQVQAGEDDVASGPLAALG
jgi:ureidoacrylate peracid hydrolase